MKRGPKTQDVRTRLERNREITLDGHWLWLGMMDRKGYGKISVDGIYQKVHRTAYKIYVDPNLPDHLQVLHKRPCNIRNCFNPEHLYTGSHMENMIDRQFTVNGSKPTYMHRVLEIRRRNEKLMNEIREQHKSKSSTDPIIPH